MGHTTLHKLTHHDLLQVKLLKEKFGYDAAFNYKSSDDFVASLKEVAPNGIDIYFENVGGKVVNPAALIHIEHMAGRCVVYLGLPKTRLAPIHQSGGKLHCWLIVILIGQNALTSVTVWKGEEGCKVTLEGNHEVHAGGTS